MAVRALKATRSDGERTRREILDTAARLSTVEGIRHLSIARLADEVGMSKSGLYAHFGSKEELQLATIDTAEAIYERDVYQRIAHIPPGRDRVIAIADAHLIKDYLQETIEDAGAHPITAEALAMAAALVGRPAPGGRAGVRIAA